jgi:hypothetical protein
MQQGSGMTEQDDLRSLIGNVRPWNSFWFWRDKPVGERGAARQILEQAGVNVEGLVSRTPGQDPPDCEATVGGQLVGIELTELVHRETLERSLKAIKERKAGKEPDCPEAYFAWERDDLISALQALIHAKDNAEKLKGGPYYRYFLIIFTDEFMLDRDTVAAYIDGVKFQTALITDVFLGLSYHPSTETGGGCCPVFRLDLVPR